MIRSHSNHKKMATVFIRTLFYFTLNSQWTKILFLLFLNKTIHEDIIITVRLDLTTFTDNNIDSFRL